MKKKKKNNVNKLEIEKVKRLIATIRPTMDSRKWKIFLVHKILNQQLIKIEKRLQKENNILHEFGRHRFVSGCKNIGCIRKIITTINTATVCIFIFLCYLFYWAGSGKIKRRILAW